MAHDGFIPVMLTVDDIEPRVTYTRLRRWWGWSWEASVAFQRLRASVGVFAIGVTGLTRGGVRRAAAFAVLEILEARQ